VEVIGDAKDKKADKHKRSAEEYTETRQKAIKSSAGFTTTDNKEVRRMLKAVVQGRRKSEGETVFFWHRERKECGWNTNEDMRQQAKIWKKQMKQGVPLEFLEHNNQTKLVNGEEWHILVCGHADYAIDPLGMGIDDGIFMVSGYIYWFRHK
jgi:hypothetical protein